MERALTLLSAVAQEGGTLSQLARAAELSPSTASRLLATLVSQELVRRDEHGQYHAGARLRHDSHRTHHGNDDEQRDYHRDDELRQDHHYSRG